MRQLGLRLSDQGRRIGELKLGLCVEDLESKILEVLRSLLMHREEVRSPTDDWFSLRIRPYRTRDDRITGAVLVLIDISEQRRATELLRNARILAEGVLGTIRQPLVVLDAKLSVVMASAAFYKTFSVAEAETVGRRVYELGDGQWDQAELRRLLEEIIPRNSRFEGFEIVYDFPRIGRQRALLDACRIEQEGNRPYLVLLTVAEMRDV